MKSLRGLLLAPAAALMASLFTGPLLIVCAYSLLSRGPYGGVVWSWTLENYARLWDPLYAVIFLRTLVMAAAAAVLCVVLAFPLALFISRAGSRRNLHLLLVMLPFWTSFLVRTYAWMFLLRDTGLINTLLLWTGVIREPLPLLHNQGAVLLGLIYAHLPFAVLPLYVTLERMDKSVLEASADLGGGRLATLWHVVVPLSKPGIVAAAVLTFIASFGAFLTPDLLGGGKSVMVGTLIQNQFTTARDWPFGAALSLAVMLVTIALMLRAARSGDALR